METENKLIQQAAEENAKDLENAKKTEIKYSLNRETALREKIAIGISKRILIANADSFSSLSNILDSNDLGRGYNTGGGRNCITTNNS